MIDVSALRKSFGTVDAVRDVSFNAASGRVTGLLGPNGAGKSTTLRMMYGLLRPDHGSVKIDGIDVQRDVVSARRKMGVLPDTLGLYRRLTAREIIRYFGRLQGLNDDVIERRSNELTDLLDMRDIIDRRSDGFSHGQKMKVCLARCLVHSPPNVLLDEPTNGLDVMTTRAVRELIAQLKANGVTVLFSSHLMHEVARLCDHVVIISQGIVVAQGNVDDIRAKAGESDLEDAFVKLSESVLDGAQRP